MKRVTIPGYNSTEEPREFEILEREELEKLIDELSPSEIYKQTFEQARDMQHSGTAYTYIDARDGKLNTCWLGQNNFNHPWDDFYEIWLCSLKTGQQMIDLDTPEDILATDEEWEQWNEFDGSLEEMLGEKIYQERFENAVDWEATEFEFDEEHIKLQLDGLYNR